jgi:hypothetical protein
MGKTYDAIDDRMAEFIGRQHLFFVGTAPSDPDGRLNISPKGHDTLRVLGPKRVAYLDLTGSGVETIAHLRENGRMTIMFCAFEGRPVIVRLQGRGRVVEPTDAEWPDLAPRFPDLPGARAAIVLDVDRVSDSCGLSVPFYEYRGERSGLLDFARKKGPEGMAEYRRKKNAVSIDGIPGLSPSEIPTDA